MKEAFGEGDLVSGVGAQFAFGKLKPSGDR
jgi:hypothetical protein